MLMIILNFLFAIFIGFLGLFGHWIKRYVRKQTTNNFVRYLEVHSKYTKNTASAVFAGISAVFLSGDLPYLLTFDLLPILAIWLYGFTIDSTLNKG